MTPFVDTVRHSLRTFADRSAEPLQWAPVSMPGLSIAWVGITVPDVGCDLRPWLWEVVTPGDFETLTPLHDDPMVLPVAQDTVVVTVHHSDHSGPIARLQVPVSAPVEAIELDEGTLPGEPWSFAIETGWTAESLGEAAQQWIDREVGCAARLETPAPREPESYQLTPSICIESAAFDRLLTLEPHEAAVVSSSLAAIHEALAPYR